MCRFNYRQLCNFSNHIIKRTFKKNISTINSLKMAKTSNVKPQLFTHFLVLDFEATCDEGKQMLPQEIIEFPCLMVNAKSLQTESTFHYYVQPRVNRQLTPFCTELTGIIQSMVDDQPHIEEVLEKFDKWLEDNGLLKPENKFIFVTCGDWDLKTMLPSQLKYFSLNTKPYFNSWINIKKPYNNLTTQYPSGMMAMLHKLNIPHEGRHHSGIDDCKNIAKILVHLIEKGQILKPTGKL